MEPHQARLTLFVFLALSASIVFNALYLQKDAGLAVRAHDRYIESARLQPQAEPSPGSDLVRAIERELQARSYHPGYGNGVQQATMTGAIMAYQFDHDLPMTGVVSDELLKAILFGSMSPTPSQGGSSVKGEVAGRLVAEIQGILSSEGYYNGEIDGQFGLEMVAAVRKYESDQDLPVTGRISGLLVLELGRTTGVRFTSPRS